MSTDGGTSLTLCGDLSKPATALIEKVSQAIGGICAPYQLKRMAKAEVEAALIRAKGEQELLEVTGRAAQRFLAEETLRQINMENIANRSIELLEETAHPEDIDNDWIVNFFNKCRNVSDEKMQEIWAKLLSQEAAEKGSFSKKTVNILHDMESSDAILFAKICDFTVHIQGLPNVIITGFQTKLYNDSGINYNTISMLSHLGLVEHAGSGSFNAKIHDTAATLHVGKTMVPIEETIRSIPLGVVEMTRAGYELSRLTTPNIRDDFTQHILDFYKHLSP